MILVVAKPAITILPFGPIHGAVVGNPLSFHCVVYTVNGVEVSSVLISWMKPGGESITSDSRHNISQTTVSGNHFASHLRFSYLMEGDEGIYTCNVMILETNSSDTVLLNVLTGWLIILSVLFCDKINVCI